MSEKRKHRRVNLLYNLKVYDLKTTKYLGHLVDISSGGFKMLSKAPVRPDKEFHFRIDLSESVCDIKHLQQRHIPAGAKRTSIPITLLLDSSLSGYQ